MPAPKGAGDLRQKVKFQRRGTSDPDEYGNAEEGWADFDPVLERSCSLAPTRGGEAVQSARLTGSASWDLWVRADSRVKGVTVADRVVDLRTDQTFNIRFGPADMDGKNKWLFLQLEAGVADG